LFTIIDPQDEVILLAPYWVSYPEMVKMVHGVPVPVTPEDGTFHPRMEDIERHVTDYTKAVIVNSPCNPSGVVYSPDFIREIVSFCEEKGIYLIMDDIYQKLVENGVRPANAYEYAKKDLENSKLIIVNGVSKLYGMTGFRIGWVVARRKLIETMAKIQSQITSNPSVISQAAAEGALLGVQSVVENLRLEIQNHRKVMIQELEAFNGVRIVKPQGTFYCLPDFRAYETDSIKLSNFLLEKALVVTVPGVDFGMEGHLRLSYAGSIKDVTEGIERLKWALDPKAPNEIYIGDRKLERDWL
jgi:aspartate aminotransferase